MGLNREVSVRCAWQDPRVGAPEVHPMPMLPFSPSNRLQLMIAHTSSAKLSSYCNGRVASVKPPIISKLVIASETRTESG